MRKFTFIGSLILALCAVSCDDKRIGTNACTDSATIDNVPWLVDLKNSMTDCTCELSIIKGKYQGEHVIFIALTDPLCDGIDTPTLYDCYGNEVRRFTESAADQKELMENVSRDSVIHRCKT
jgi:hypothetical protein